MKLLLVTGLAVVPVFAAFADAGNPLVTTVFTSSAPTNTPAATAQATEVLRRVLANRPAKDLALKARLLVTPEQIVPLELLVRNTPAETRTIYRAAKAGLDLLIVQPVGGPPRWYRRGQGELTGTAREQRLLESQFTAYDLGTPFLWWPGWQATGTDRVRGQDCVVLECAAPADAPYARVKLWVHALYYSLLKAEAYDAAGATRRRFAVTSVLKVGDAWFPRGLEMATVLPDQALPAQDKSRLEVQEHKVEQALPAEWFDERNFQ